MKLNTETINKTKLNKRLFWIKFLSLIYITFSICLILGLELRLSEFIQGLLFILVFNLIIKSVQLRRLIEYLFYTYIVYNITEYIILRFYFKLQLLYILEFIKWFLLSILGLSLFKTSFKIYGISILLSSILLVVAPIVYANLVKIGFVEINLMSKRIIFIFLEVVMLIPFCILIFLSSSQKKVVKYILDDNINLDG